MFRTRKQIRTLLPMKVRNLRFNSGAGPYIPTR